MVETVDRYGLKTRFSRKHQTAVERFFRFLGESEFRGEAALKCKQRFEKNRDTLFTFLRYDGVPGTTTTPSTQSRPSRGCADVIAGTSSRKGIDEYLTLLSVAETCEYRGLDFLDFLRSGERDVYAFR